MSHEEEEEETMWVCDIPPLLALEVLGSFSEEEK